MAFVAGAALPRAAPTQSPACRVRMSDESVKVSRRSALAAGLAAAAAVLLPKQGVKAEIDYGNVGYLGGGDIVDVNNANVRVYAKFPGMYPTLGGLIVQHGPYKSVDELYAIPGLTENQKATIEKYKSKLVALEPSPQYELDKINNGLYR